MTAIGTNIIHVRKRIAAACSACGRDPASVKLLLATKTVAPQAIMEAIANGCSLIAENKVQELKQKFGALQASPHEQHFIGHLQSNKIKELLRYNVTCIQSLDRLDKAMLLHRQLLAEGRSIDAFIQVNTSFEDSKFGASPAAAEALVRAIAPLQTIRIKGLMTIGVLSTDVAESRKCFRLLRELAENIDCLNIPHVSMKELSMGMSGDLELAIEEGSTMVRIGTAIFGAREYPDSHYWNELD